jgi:hypothetical protein
VAESGGQPGNKNNTKGKPISDAFRRALTGEVNADRLAKLIEKYVVKAEDGDFPVFKEIIDRLEGKAAQTVQGTGEQGEIILKVTQDDESVL